MRKQTQVILLAVILVGLPYALKIYTILFRLTRQLVIR